MNKIQEAEKNLETLAEYAEVSLKQKDYHNAAEWARKAAVQAERLQNMRERESARQIKRAKNRETVTAVIAEQGDEGATPRWIHETTGLPMADTLRALVEALEDGQIEFDGRVRSGIYRIAKRDRRMADVEYRVDEKDGIVIKEEGE